MISEMTSSRLFTYREKEDSNPLAAFLANGSEYYQILHKPGMNTTLEQLDKAFVNYMNFDRHAKGCIGSNTHAIKDAGYVMKVLHLCKVCDNESKKTTCGAHYNARNRRKKMCIMDMEIRSLKPKGDYGY